jgi:hypothetical protein
MAWSKFRRHTACGAVAFVILSNALPLTAETPAALPVSREQMLETHINSPGIVARCETPAWRLFPASILRLRQIGKLYR